MMTAEERQARTLELNERVANFGPDPETLAEIEALYRDGLPAGEGLPTVEQPPPVVAHAPNGNGAAAPADVFTAGDLDLWTFPAERVRMPNGKSVWVHALSPSDCIYLGRQVAREIAKAGITADNERQGEALFRGHVWQTILACRTGESPTSPRVFRPEDAEKLRKGAGWYETVQRIAQASDRMGAGEEPEREVLRAFFGTAARFLQTWCTRLTADSWEEGRRELERFATCVSRVSSRGSLASVDVREVAALSEDA